MPERKQQQYQKFEPPKYEKKEGPGGDGPKRELKAPTGIDDLLDEVDASVSKSNLSQKYRQESGQ